MRRWALVLTGIGWAGAALAAPTANDLGTMADAAVARPLDRGVCRGIAVGVIANGVETMRFYGDDGHGAPPDAKTEFEIGSLTKIFTTTLLALEVKRGRMKLDDAAQTYALPGLTMPAFEGKPITLAELAAHMSGLPRKVPGDDKLTLEAMIRFVSGYRLSAAPGTTYLYSNLAIGLLGLIVAGHEGATVADLYAKEITGPLGMRDTAFILNDEQHTRLAIGYGPKGNEAPEDVPAWPVLESAAALRSTLTDMMIFLHYQIGGAPGDLGAVLPLMRTPLYPVPNDMQVGLSWMFRRLGTQRMIAKDGSAMGFAAYIAFVPETGTGVLVLANTKPCPVRLISDRIMAKLNGAPSPDAAKAAPEPDDHGEN